MKTQETNLVFRKSSDAYPFSPLSRKAIISELKKAQKGKYKKSAVVRKELHARYGL